MDNKLNEKQDVKEVAEKKEKKISIISLVLIGLGLAIVIAFIAIMSSSKTNFDMVKDGKEPNGYKDKINYKKDDKDVTYYKYSIYKIEVIKDEKQISYTLKPFFSKDY